jgi:hypothetical protein
MTHWLRVEYTIRVDHFWDASRVLVLRVGCVLQRPSVVLVRVVHKLLACSLERIAGGGDPCFPFDFLSVGMVVIL